MAGKGSGEPPHARAEPTGELERLRALNAVLQVTATVADEDLLLRQVLAALGRGFSARMIEVVVPEGADRRVRYRFEHQHDGVDRIEEPLRQQGIHAEVHARDRPVVLERGGESLAVADGVEDAYIACVPLRGRDRSLGSLLTARETVAHSTAELEMLATVGRYVALAIEHARLFRRAVTDAERLERMVARKTAALRDRRTQLARSRWLTALGELAAGVAHDLNNALNPVVAFAELLKAHPHDPARVRTYADRILLAAGDGAETVRRIQRFTRRQDGSDQPEAIRLATVVREAVDLTRPAWAERKRGGPIEIVQDMAPELVILGRPGEFRQVLLNLIGNSFDAMPEGGTLRFIGRAEEAKVVLAIQDTGRGMAEEIRTRALEPFFTTKGERGTGLGLSEVYGIVRQYEGSITIESWEGVGTTVLLRLPAYEAGPHAAEEEHDVRSNAARALSILLVDDNVLNLEAQAAALQARGHVVTTAVSGEEALAGFERGRFDIVLTDLGLPGMSGWKLLEELRTLDPELPTGVITGWSLEESEAELSARGVVMAFLKPVDPQRLLDELARVPHRTRSAGAPEVPAGPSEIQEPHDA